MALARAQVDRVARFVAGTLLLVPALLAFALALWGPALRTLGLSLQAAVLGRPSHLAGLANYRQLAADAVFAAALGRSLLVALVRVTALAMPAVLAGLCSCASPRGHRPGRVALAVPAGLSAPVALALLWRLAGRQVPCLQRLDLTDPAVALPSYLGLEGVAFLGLGGALAAAALLSARDPRSRRGVLWLAAIAAAASGLDSFTLPFTATGGGPSGATLTLPLHAFRTAFLRLRLGEAAAQASLPLLASLALGLAFAALSDRLGLRLALAGEARRHEPQSTQTGMGSGEPEEELRSTRRVRTNGATLKSLRVLCSKGLLALYLAPFLLAYLWSMGQAFHPVGGSLASAAEVLMPGLSLLNSTLAPLLGTLCIGLPAAYLAALSLSLLHPFGRRGSRIVHLLLVAGGFVPTVAAGIGLYDGVRAAGLYNSPLAPALPFAANAPALYLLKLYFDGQAPLLAKATGAGQPALAAFFQLAFRPSLRVAGAAGAVSLFLAGRSLLWPLLVLAQRDLMPLSLRLAVMQNGLAGERGALGAGCWLLLTAWGAGTLLAWCLLVAPFLQRFEVVAEAEGALLPAGLERGLRGARRLLAPFWPRRVAGVE